MQASFLFCSFCLPVCNLVATSTSTFIWMLGWPPGKKGLVAIQSSDQFGKCHAGSQAKCIKSKTGQEFGCISLSLGPFHSQPHCQVLGYGVERPWTPGDRLYQDFMAILIFTTRLTTFEYYTFQCIGINDIYLSKSVKNREMF